METVANLETGGVLGPCLDQDKHETQKTVMESEELTRLKEENRSLKIKIAGVDTLSSLLNGTRDELDTVLAEKDCLEIEVATLQCRCSMLEKEIAEKRIGVQESRTSKEMFESVLRENKQLKNELKQIKINRPPANEGLFDAESMFGLLTFKNEVEKEIKNIQQVMKKEEGESQITQISRLLGQVSKLESNIKTKDEEMVALKSEMENLKQRSSVLVSNASLQNSELAKSEDVHLLSPACKKDIGVQTTSITDIKEDDKVIHERIKKNSTSVVSSSSKPKRSSSLRRRNSKRASGDWTNIKKSHSDIFEDSWCLDDINPSEQLKVTQDLLVQANEIIMIMTEENDKLLRINAALLEELSKDMNDNGSTQKSSVKDRLQFLFSELSFDDIDDDTEEIQEILISTEINNLRKEDLQEKELCMSLEKSCQLDPPINNNNSATGEESNKFQDASLQDMNTKNTRDSGVDIFPMETDHCSLSPTRVTKDIIGREIIEEISSSDLRDSTKESTTEDDCHLECLLEEKSKQLTDAAAKILELQAKISSFEENEKKRNRKREESRTPYPNGKRLCKSVSNIPNSVHLPITYQRIVLESDI